MGKRKKQSHCSECGTSGYTVRTHCFICNTHCKNPNNASICKISKKNDVRGFLNSELEFPDSSNDLTSSQWLDKIMIKNNLKIVSMKSNGENLFNCLALAIKASDCNHIPTTSAELRVIVGNELQNPTGKGYGQDYVDSQVARTSSFTNLFFSKSKSLMEHRNNIKKPFRQRGEFGCKLSLKAISNRFKLRINILDPLKKHQRC